MQQLHIPTYFFDLPMKVHMCSCCREGSTAMQQFRIPICFFELAMKGTLTLQL